tara:strand:+ start:579 stop:767 length:189 start_codon:yes stop_codon:yes gene_type:complete
MGIIEKIIKKYFLKKSLEDDSRFSSTLNDYNRALEKFENAANKESNSKKRYNLKKKKIKDFI